MFAEQVLRKVGSLVASRKMIQSIVLELKNLVYCKSQCSQREMNFKSVIRLYECWLFLCFHCKNHLMCMVCFKFLIFLAGLDTFSGCVQCGSTRLWWYWSSLSLPRRHKMCNQNCMHFQHPGNRILPL